MFNKIKRAFSHSASTSHPGEKKDAASTSQPGEKEDVVSGDGSDEEEDATQVLDDKVKRTNTLKDKRKGRAKGPKNRRSPSKKKKPLFDRFLAKFHINKKEKNTEDTEIVKVTTEEDAKASEVLNVVEKTEVLQRVERAPPPKNRRRPQRHNQHIEQPKTRTSPVTKENEDSLHNGANLVSVEKDVNEEDKQERTNNRFAAKDEKTKRKILTPKTFSMDKEKEVDSKSKPPLPGKEKPLKEKQDSSANERKTSEESMDSNPRHSASDEEDAAKINLFSNVASELGMKLAKKDESLLEDTEHELNDNKIQIIEKPKIPTAKKPPKQEKPQIHTILEESESLDSTLSIEEQIHRLPDKNGNNINLHNTHEIRKKEKPTLPLNKKPNKLNNEKLSEENSEPFHDPDTFSEKLSTTPVKENIHNALAAELQKKLASKPQVENPKQKPNLPQKKKPITKEKVKSTTENQQNETNDTKEVVDKPKKPQIPSKQKPKKAVVNRDDENERSPKDEMIDLNIEDKENDNYNKETVERDLKYKPASQVKPQIPKSPTKDITLEIINQDDNNNENIGTSEHINQSIEPVTNGKNKAPVKPPRTKRRVQSSSEIPNNDKEAPKRRTQSNSENKTPDKEILPDFDMKKKLSFDEEPNYTMPQSSVDSLTDNEDLSDLFDVFDQEFDDQIKSLPVSRKGSVISMSRSSVRSLSRGSTPSYREPVGIDEELTELLLEIANNELDMTIELNKIENNNSDMDESDIHEEVKNTIDNKNGLDSKEDKANKLDKIQKASEISYNTVSNSDLTEKQEWIEDFIPSTKQILNPRENKKEDDHMSKVSETNEAKISNKAKKQNEDNTNMNEMTSETIAKNITEDNKQNKEDNLYKETSKAKESKISSEDTQQIEDVNDINISVKTNEARISSDEQNSSKISDTNEENNSNEHKQNKEDAIIISKTASKTAKQKFDLGEGDIIQNFQKFYKSQQSQSEVKATVDESHAIKVADDGPLSSLHDNSKSAEASPGTSLSPEITATTNKTAVPQSPSEGTRIPPSRPRPGRPTPPGKKPQLNRLRNQNIPKTKNETPKPDSPSATLDLFALGTEPSFVNEKDSAAKKSTEDKKVPVTNSTQHQHLANKSDSSQSEYKQDTIYSNFQRPRAESHESSIKPPRAEMHRLQSVPGVTNRNTPPTSRQSPKHRHTTPQIYVELGGKAPKPTYIEPGQINQAGRERSDSLRSSSPRKKNESKEKSDESQDDH